MVGRPFEKGNKGKPKGALNKSTRDIKQAYQMLIEKNLDNMTEWLEIIAKKDPAKAIYIITELSEYVIPKLSRSEVKAEVVDKTETIERLKKFRENLSINEPNK